MEAKFFRDYKHSYIILKCRQKEAIKSYPYKMLSSQRIAGVLKCSIRYINSAAYLYYDISSRTTLEQLYQSRKMDCGQVRELLEQLYAMMAELNTYFLDERCLVMLPEYLYYDMAQKQYLGVYYPEYEEGENYYEPLFDFLLNHIDTEDKALADCVYQLYEMSEESYFSLEDALRLFEKEADEVEETAAYSPKEAFEEAVYEQAADEYPDFSRQTEQEESESGRKRSLFYPIFALLSALGIAGAFGVGYFYELTQQEQRIVWGCMALMGGCLLFSVIQTAWGIKRKGGAEKTPEEPAQDISFYEETRVPLDNVMDKNMKIEMARDDYLSRERAAACDGRADRTVGAAQPEYENTVFFDRNENVEYKLYAMDKKNKRHIELKKFPCTIGKMAGYVDFVLPDDSVSRIHARFDRQGDSVMLTDMNSTNGTFKNGLRMQPQETVEIEPGDEIRFGKLNYSYR